MIVEVGLSSRASGWERSKRYGEHVRERDGGRDQHRSERWGKRWMKDETGNNSRWVSGCRRAGEKNDTIDRMGMLEDNDHKGRAIRYIVREERKRRCRRVMGRVRKE